MRMRSKWGGTFAAAVMLLSGGWHSPPAAATPAQRSRPAAKDAQVLVAQGLAALERGDEAAAKTLFQRALTVDPKNVDGHTYLGLLADRTGDLHEAERHFAAAAAAAPAAAPARNNYGAILLRLGRMRPAAAEFAASLKLDPDQPSALVNLAQIRYASGELSDLREARKLFERAQAIAPDAEIARSLVVTSLRLGEKDAAAAHYRDYAARIDLARAAPVAVPSARAELGTALLAGGLAGEAARELEAAVAAEPTNVSAVVALARAHLKRADIPAAGRTLEAAVARGLDAAPLYAALADVYEAGGYVENAIPAMRLAIARDPKNEAYHFRYGMLLTDTNAPAAAIIRLKEAITEFPRSSRLWVALGIAHLASEEIDAAMKSFERGAELDPTFGPALAYLGMAHAERGQYHEALKLYQRAIALDEQLPVVHFLVADVLLRETNVDAEVVGRYLKRSIQLDPDFAPARLALARLLMRAEQWEAAAAHLEHVIRSEPNLAEAHYQLGRALIRLKRKAEAEKSLATFKRLSEAEKERKNNERYELARRLANVRF